MMTDQDRQTQSLRDIMVSNGRGRIVRLEGRLPDRLLRTSLQSLEVLKRRNSKEPSNCFLALTCASGFELVNYKHEAQEALSYAQDLSNCSFNGLGYLLHWMLSVNGAAPFTIRDGVSEAVVKIANQIHQGKIREVIEPLRNYIISEDARSECYLFGLLIEALLYNEHDI